MAGDPNILRVGAEFDVSPIIESTEAAVSSIDQLQEALTQIALNAEAVDDTLTENAARFMAQGMSAQDAASALVNLGASEAAAAATVKAITDALAAQTAALAGQSTSTATSTTTTQQQTTALTANVNALHQRATATTQTIPPQVGAATATAGATTATAQQTVVTGGATAQIAALQQQINALNQQLAQLQQQLANTTTRTGGMTSAMGAARVEAGALTGSTGMMVGGLARVAAQSAVLGPIIQAAFPIFAIVAMIAILDQLISKLMEWADLARKTAEQQAEFDRAMLKSADALNQARSHMAGLASSNAELAEKSQHTSDKVLDLSETFKKANERIEDSDTYFKRLKEGLGIVTVAIGESIGVVDKSQRDLEEWNSKISENVKHQGDLTLAIRQVTEELHLLDAERDAAAGGGDDREVREIQRRIDVMQEVGNKLVRMRAEQQLEDRSLEIEQNQKSLEEHEKTLKARASMDESMARAELRAHTVTLEEERTLLLSAETERTRAEESIINSRISLLHREAQEGIISKQAEISGIKQLDEERARLEVESATHRADITNTTDQEILRRTITIGEAQIDAAHKISETQAKLEEDRAKRAFKEADSTKEIEETAQTLTDKTTKSYEDQIVKLQQRAALLERTFTIQKGGGVLGQAVTADLGTDQFKTQVAQIEGLNSELYSKLVAFDAEVHRLQLLEVDHAEETAREKADRLKKIAREEADEQIAALRENLTREEALYHEDITHLEELHDQKKLTLREFTQAAIMFAQQEFQARSATLQQEADKLKAERDADLITETQYAKKVQELHAQLAKFREQMEKQITDFQKSEIAKREQQLSAEVKKMSDEFIAGVNKMITGQERFSRAVAEMGRNIALHLIDQGIQRVATKYGEEFAKMLASHLSFVSQFISSHSSFLATLLGIETAGNAKKTSETILANTAQINSDAGVSFAAGFASVMAAVPFPDNVVLAPQVAAAAALSTEAGALGNVTFEHGGIVDATLHHGEMVLPQHISTAIQGAVPAISKFNRTVNNTEDNSRGGDVHNHFNLPTHIGNMSALDGASMKAMLEQHDTLIGKIAVSAVKRHFRTNGVGG